MVCQGETKLSGRGTHRQQTQGKHQNLLQSYRNSDSVV